MMVLSLRARPNRTVGFACGSSARSSSFHLLFRAVGVILYIGVVLRHLCREYLMALRLTRDIDVARKSEGCIIGPALRALSS